MKGILRIHLGDEGQNMVEYALLAAILSIATIGILVMVSPEVHNAYLAVVNGLATTSHALPTVTHGCPRPDPIRNPHC